MLGIIIQIMQNAKSKLKRVQEKELQVYIPALIYSSQRRHRQSSQIQIVLPRQDPTAPPEAGHISVPRGFGQEFSLHEKIVSRFLAMFLHVFNLGC